MNYEKNIITCMLIILTLTACAVNKEKGYVAENIEVSQTENTMTTEPTEESEGTISVTVPLEDDENDKIEEDDKDIRALPKEIQEVLYHDKTFFDAETKKEYTKKTFEVLECGEWKKDLVWGTHMAYDFDQDGENELAVVVELGPSSPIVIALDSQEGKVYAYTFVYRGFLHVWKDAVIEGASAADMYTFYRVKFDKGECQEIIVADVTSEKNESGLYDSVWYLGDKKVSEEEFYEFTDKRNEIEQIEWNRTPLDSLLD